MMPELKTLKDKYNFTSHLYDILDLPFEYFRYRRLREMIWKFASGRILDAGVGTGRNIKFYPSDVEVIGIDLSEGMIKKAKKRAEKNNIAVKLYPMDILNMSFPDNYFDTVVATFVFCVIPESLQTLALREIRRVCKRDGEIILLEYTFSQKRFRRLWMKIISPYVRWLYGAGFDRATSAYIKKEGFPIIEDAFVVDDVIRLIRMKAYA